MESIRNTPSMNPNTRDASISRRRFLQTLTTSCVALSLPPLRAAGGHDAAAGDDSFDSLSRDLLRDWCDGMLAVQIHDPADPARHGALGGRPAISSTGAVRPVGCCTAARITSATG